MYVWVTETTNTCYQGQQCERCGSMQKPYFVAPLRDNAARDGLPPPIEGFGTPNRKHIIKKHCQMNRLRGN